MKVCVFFFFKQKTAYEVRISDWSSDVCSSDRWIIGALKLSFLGGAQPSVFRMSALLCAVAPWVWRWVIRASRFSKCSSCSKRRTGRMNACLVTTPPYPCQVKIGREPVRTPVTNEHIVCRILHEQH